MRNTGHLVHQGGHHFATGCRRDEHGRLAIADDVLHFRLLQPPAYGGVVKAGALGGPADLKEPGMVFQQQGDVVSPLEPELAKQVRALIRSPLELSESDGLARIGHDVGNLLWVGRCDDSRMHAVSLGSARCERRPS